MLLELCAQLNDNTALSGGRAQMTPLLGPERDPGLFDRGTGVPLLSLCEIHFLHPTPAIQLPEENDGKHNIGQTSVEPASSFAGRKRTKAERFGT